MHVGDLDRLEKRALELLRSKPHLEKGPPLPPPPGPPAPPTPPPRRWDGRARTWWEVLAEIARCDPLCADCHQLEHKEQL